MNAERERKQRVVGHEDEMTNALELARDGS
jgi:hypothetical protein